VDSSSFLDCSILSPPHWADKAQPHLSLESDLIGDVGRGLIVGIVPGGDGVSQGRRSEGDIVSASDGGGQGVRDEGG
jgi:hypothetical protein